MPYLVIAVGFFPDGTVVGVTRNGIIGHYRIDLNHQIGHRNGTDASFCFGVPNADGVVMGAG